MKDKKDKQKYKELIRKDDSPMATPPVVEPCTACDEAKYEVQCFTIMGKYEVHYFIIMGNYEVENFTIIGDEVISFTILAI